MIRMALPDLQRRPGSGYASGFSCDACHKGTSMALFHCDLCNYDLCRPCGMSAIGRCQCPIGHPLIRFTKDDFLAFDKHTPSRNCNSCKKTDTYPFMMICPSCDYKMCPTCFKDQVVCCNILPMFCYLFITFFFHSLNQSVRLLLLLLLSLFRSRSTRSTRSIRFILQMFP